MVNAPLGGFALGSGGGIQVGAGFSVDGDLGGPGQIGRHPGGIVSNAEFDPQLRTVELTLPGPEGSSDFPSYPTFTQEEFEEFLAGIPDDETIALEQEKLNEAS